MPPGRRPSIEPRRRMNLSLPSKLLDEVTLFLPKDLLTGDVAYGAWSTLIEQLLRSHLKKEISNV